MIINNETITVRNDILLEQLVLVDGQDGCGKTLLTAIVAGFTEKDELNKRREFAVNQGASKEALEVLDEMSAQYEDQYLKGMI